MSGSGRGPARRGRDDEDRPGVRFRDADALVARALATLEEAPRTSEALARRVLGLRRAPPGLAERLVGELLGGDPRVRVDAEGVWRLRRVGRSAGRRLDELGYAVVDVETTGGVPRNGGRVVEVAVVRVRSGRIRGQFSSLVNPGVPLEPWVSRLTGISDRELADAPRFAEIGHLVRRELEGRVFVAHNAAFDWRFVSEEMRRAGSLLPTGPRLCTLRFARRALPGLERRGLDAVAAYYGIEVRPRHRAAGDAVATARLLLRLLDEASRRGIEEWGPLRRWLRGGGALRDGGLLRGRDGSTGEETGDGGGRC